MVGRGGAPTSAVFAARLARANGAQENWQGGARCRQVCSQTRYFPVRASNRFPAIRHWKQVRLPEGVEI